MAITVDSSGADDTAAIQAAIDAIRPDGVGRGVYLPAARYKVSSTITVPTDTRIFGDGSNYTGTSIINTMDAPVFDCRVTSSPSSAKDATRIEFDGLQFFKASPNFNTTAYCIDMVGADMCSVTRCSFGNHVWGCMNGIKFGASGVNWIDKCRFLDIGRSSRSGAAVGTSGDDAAIRVDSTSDAINVNDCQFESGSKILLYNARGCCFKGCHGEYTVVDLHNSSHNTFEDATFGSIDFRLDSKSNDNRIDNLAGVSTRVIDMGSNTWRRTSGAQNVGRLTRDFGPYNGETSPLKPDRIATAWDTVPATAYGNPGDVILFAVHAISPVNATPTTGTIRFKSGGVTLHASSSLTLGAVFPTAGQLSSKSLETFTYWHMETVPVGGKISLDSEFRLSVWASKVVNPNPFLNSLANWANGQQTAGNFSTHAGCTPSMSGTQFRVDWTQGAGWSVNQYINWPAAISSRYLMVLRGRWAATQGLTLGDNTVHLADDLARIRSKWKAGDEAFNLQTTDKMMFAVVQPGITTGATSSKYFIVSFGGFPTDFPVNTQVEIDWCAVAPLDS